MLLNAEAGSPGGNAITALWLLVAYWALLGNVQAIQTTSKYVLILQVVVGTIIFISLQNNSNMQLYFGSPDIFLLGISIPTIAWGILYWWASTKIATSNIEEKGIELAKREAERLEGERLEAEQLEMERKAAKRVREAFLETQRLEAEQLEIKRQKSKVLKQEKREAWLSLLNTMGRPVILTMITLLVLFIISLQV